MRRILLVLALCGCASTQSVPDDTTPRQPAIFSDPTTGTIMGDAPQASRATIVADPTAVWAAAKRIYLDWEVPVNIENPSAHQLGNANFYKTRQFAGQPMTSLVSCGSGMDGPKAASYRIYMSLLTTVQGDGKGGTVVQTTFVPAGQDMTGNSTDRISCGTTGRLESLFLQRLNAMVGKS